MDDFTTPISNWQAGTTAKHRQHVASFNTPDAQGHFAGLWLGMSEVLRLLRSRFQKRSFP
ncbi:hypothetical protein [Granulicella pectinivorans]|uniref:hypothetical protein n=1 Tax=Granulicella pectinivorans TaxID=474950 RepID=UPI001586F956|nr:hypothetical protein [Granulicella pectinivorans]